MKRYLRTAWLQSDNFDPLGILLYQQELGFAFAVHDCDIIHDISSALNVFRLERIRQLGFLHDPVMNEVAGNCGIGSLFEHTRYMHSLTVMATASLIGFRSGLSPRDLTHLRVAAVTHDVLTPAGGDSIKFIDPEAFNEDTHYHEIFQNNPEWSEVRDRYKLDEELLATIVRGEGLLGQLLDIADKTSYVAHDVDAYMMGNDPRIFHYFKSPDSLMEIWNIRNGAGHPLCDLWDHIAIKNGRVVITNGRRLAEFLKLRALMFRHLYYNPKARYREQMLGILIVDPLYRSGIVTRKQLISMSDNELYSLLDRSAGRGDLFWALSRSDFAPEVESYRDLATAKARAQSLITRNPNLLVMFEIFPPISNKAVRYFVQDKNGAALPFAEAYPEEAKEILMLSSDPNPAILYVLDIKKTNGVISADLQKALLVQQRKRIGLE